MFSSFFNDQQQQQKLPDLPSPKNLEEFQQLADKLFQDVLFLEKDSSDWQLVIEKEDVGVWELPTRQKGAAVCVKSKGTMPRSAKFVWNKMWSDGVDQRKLWEPDILEVSTLETLNESMRIDYRAYSAPYPVTPRDFVSLTCRRSFEDGLCVTWGTSVNYSKQPESDRFVRGVVEISALIVRPLPNDPKKCMCTRIIQMDPRGSIPQWVVTLSKKRGADGFLRLRKLLASTPEETNVEIPKLSSNGTTTTATTATTSNGLSPSSSSTTTTTTTSTSSSNHSSSNGNNDKRTTTTSTHDEDDEDQFQEAEQFPISDESPKMQTVPITPMRSNHDSSSQQGTPYTPWPSTQSLSQQSPRAQQQQFSPEVSQMVQTLQESLALIKFDLKNQNEKISRLEQQQSKPVIRLSHLGIDVWLFILLWPFAASRLWRWLKSRQRK